MKIESLVIHGGKDGDEYTGAVNVPIYQTSTFKQEKLGVNKGYEYSRTGNPTREAVEKLISDLEEGQSGFAFASGMAAITAVLSLFKTGDKIIISNNVYGGTFRVLDKVFNHFNIGYKIVDTSKVQEIRDNIDKDVKAIYIESPTNPLMDITDIKLVSSIAKENNLLTIVDNTFMTPYLQKPLTLGADIVLHSATKYLGGHSDLVAGLVVVNNKDLAEKLHFIQNSTGGVLGPFDSFLLIRGIKTLAVRMDRHTDNAKKIASLLNHRKEIEKVYYPGLEEHIGHEVQKKQASGYGAIISFVINEKYDYKKFIENLKLITFGESLGGVESLICHPASMTHAAIPYEIRQKVGIVDNLIRLSVGIENGDDLIEDLLKALEGSEK
ncbi:cystathionine beta-lyase/cystathionine gamma-synthase [Clostridium acetobutylicum]|uniref:Cystathionine gamma-synthase n=1 Tax=Clostridium acetobutylicum (strain ATCC 824 / DSM 792 / JCM 1419 / IAM 19013 / LMG 5710 / NBRC 13948 / NRRL B-527 / VKM B-1787 / 2291 / W) TaxID=272562 RepID=Q97KI9_CLOAB|nr:MULTISPECIES: bifunctional cystathionine gamma-lyase/homocysteine desulfhydrase [Clostridium]AAK78906.1 Cystathionine gamma-synthase [Clostridium acetobutylicum ATCC 824]ADZ19981.1 Cystathionine gamma-synthase [Clostridium acetobutylicum EA 2018]AEI34474.1 cystathionine gamma-synthase [Clostridium acetobutylicum DSM 1731]AWV80625.1 bifunctional cystathionine gamma-lyase/homocysteine desulfhydrase [Clostridium acetobutylicum]KHD35943.1 cystathionine gamma-synthase [Clostridium acetobutylicum